MIRSDAARFVISNSTITWTVIVHHCGPRIHGAFTPSSLGLMMGAIAK
jgi:hypothetical protein